MFTLNHEKFCKQIFLEYANDIFACFYQYLKCYWKMFPIYFTRDGNNILKERHLPFTIILPLNVILEEKCV
jgi:hypothetical protein